MRLKVVANYDQKYIDNVTIPELLEKIQYIYKYPTDNIKYGIFQKSNVGNKYGVILFLKSPDDSIFQYVKNDRDLEVFGYTLNLKDIIYLTEKTRLQDIYEFNGIEKIWNISLTSFTQADININNFVYQTVNQILNKCLYNHIIGLGGLSGLFLQKGSLFYSDNLSIVKDANINGLIGNYVSYSNFVLNSIDSVETILIINISKKGLKKLPKNFLKETLFVKIIYIACSHETVEYDNKELLKYYDLQESHVCNNHCVNFYSLNSKNLISAK
jgi:hypothetical protein